eukprot:GHRR01003052.1.p1 GENE.GHRR01003052.1~~GHRR01003052.1.p1  ORF type:complete len:358 (+),score=138.20 GHRR01003052.1:128-1201(+)
MSSSSGGSPMLTDLTYRRQNPEKSDDSGLPDWIHSHTPVHQAPTVSSDDASDVAGPDEDAAAAGTSHKVTSVAQAGSNKQAHAMQQGSGKAGSLTLTTAGPAAAAAASLAAVAGTIKSSVQLILPEKLIRNKVLIELEPAPHQATELSGDAGAVGRLTVNRLAADGGVFKVDLKGVLYQATVLPVAGTAVMVNIGLTDAKVESVLNDFVRLREESSYHDMGMTVEGGYGMAELMADDEDNYQLEGGEEGKEPGKAAKAKKAGAPRSKAGSKPGSKAASSSKALKPKRGVKKKKPQMQGKAAGSKAAAKPKGAAAAKGTSKPAKAAKTAEAKPTAAKGKKASSDDEPEEEWDSDWNGE